MFTRGRGRKPRGGRPGSRAWGRAEPHRVGVTPGRVGPWRGTMGGAPRSPWHEPRRREGHRGTPVPTRGGRRHAAERGRRAPDAPDARGVPPFGRSPPGTTRGRTTLMRADKRAARGEVGRAVRVLEACSRKPMPPERASRRATTTRTPPSMFRTPAMRTAHPARAPRAAGARFSGARASRQRSA